jgi:heterodisulfide reductase subunit A2
MSDDVINEPSERVGVYICHCGGNISDHVDVHQVAENIKGLPGVSKVYTNSFMCSDPGQELIEKDIESGEINRVVVASCAPSLHETTFRGAIRRAGMNPFLYEHANIREQVSWVHDGVPATNKATRLVQAAVEKAKGLKALDPIRVDAARHVTVVGGGIAGMRAALDMARQGFEVALVEHSAFLGGQAASLDRLSPTGESAPELIQDLYTSLMNENSITLYSRTRITGYKGFIGNFDITLEKSKSDHENHTHGEFVHTRGIFMDNLKKAGATTNLKTGAIILATGSKPYTPAAGEYGFDDHGTVTTLQQFIQDFASAKNDRTELIIKGRRIRRIAFVHCVGSRQIPGIHEPDEKGNLNEYCSRTCCSATLFAANQVKTDFPGVDVFDFYRDIRTYGRFQEDLYDDVSRNGVLFFRFDPPDQPVVSKNNNSAFPLNIKVKDVLTFNEEVDVDVDLVVLSTGIVPNPVTDLIAMMKLPQGADRFLQEVHPKLRPVEIANTGILLAGTCQAPMDVTEACAAAQAASVKTAVLLKKGYVELDPFVATVNPDLCTGSGECAKACPVDGAITIDQKARVNPALCTGCGICTAVCDSNAIDVSGWSLQQYIKMVDAILAA